jgi:predicted dinucleotide-binding enzyme
MATGRALILMLRGYCRRAAPYFAPRSSKERFMNTEHAGSKRISSWWGTARGWYSAALVAAAVLLTAGFTPPAAAADSPAGAPMRIGIIGAGKMGATLASLWANEGYTVMLAARDQDALRSIVQSIGHGVKAGTPQSAAEFGSVVVIAIPYGAEPKLGQELGPTLTGKVVIDIGNPYPDRDGPMALEARSEGTGVASAKFFPGARLVRAFNAISYVSLAKNAHRMANAVAIPIAADDAAARALAVRLVLAAGFAPVVVGPLSTAKSFDVGTEVYVKDMTEPQVREKLGLPARN